MNPTAPTPIPTPTPFVRRAPALVALLWLGTLLSACGGDSYWCFTDGSGSVSAGYNMSCPPDEDQAKEQMEVPAAEEGEGGDLLDPPPNPGQTTAHES